MRLNVCFCLTLMGFVPGWTAELPPITTVEHQPFVAATERLVQALQLEGSPLSEEDQSAIADAMMHSDPRQGVLAIQRVLDPLCLAQVTINPESRVSVVDGPVERELMQQGWRTFLVKVHNEAGITPHLEVSSPQAAAAYQQGSGARQRPQTEQSLVSDAESKQRFLDIHVYDRQPLKPTLSGLSVEYRVVQLFSRDAGMREATLAFSVGQGTQDLGFRNEVPLLFHCLPAVEVAFGVRDVDGSPTTAAFTVRDDRGRVYPNPARRLAPDFFFHPQVYRHDGETVHLPPGDYTVQVTRGPEYRPQQHQLQVPEGVSHYRHVFPLERWIEAKAFGWYSGDHHIHAAGCKHYDSPTEGVGPADMMRHILGEDLNVGCVLSWGPCWYTQKQYFDGRVHALSQPQNLMRYDVEVSGFPSSHAGHLCLLRLTDDNYPGTDRIEQWPSWTLPVLQWGQQQGGVVGYSHSGWGLSLPDHMPDGSRRFHRQPWGGAPQGWMGKAADSLPDYAMPPFDGIGANEYIVAVTHDACDFISTVDTPAIWELNIWYHTLNCGFRTRISGETDFPCIYGERVGLGRVYVQLDDDQPLEYDAWVQGLKDGRSYCGDGLSHLFDLRVEADEESGQAVGLGRPGPGGDISQLELTAGGRVTVRCEAAAWLTEEPSEEARAIRQRRLDEKPYWHLERARIADSRKVPVELIVNGHVAGEAEIEADGSIHPLEWTMELPHSSWIAVRILPSAHTNPIFVLVDGQPIHASQRSARWCREAVDVCWEAKQGQIRAEERAAASAAYDHAASLYDQIAERSHED